MNSPLVSVCCTTYNLEKYVSKTIDSLLKQESNFDYEIIIHDDASTDGTQQVIQSYAEKYPAIIRTIFQKKNIYTTHAGGLGYMFNNFILPKTRGTYIAICDGDDYWTDPYKLQKQIDFLRKRPECSACVTNAMIVNEITNEENIYCSKLDDDILPKNKLILTGGGIYPTSSLMFNKKKFTSAKFYQYYNDFSKYFNCDSLFIYCLLFEGKIGFLRDCTVVYRRWEGGIYSGIMHNSAKVSKIKEREIKGSKNLLKMVTRYEKKLFKRKISINSLYILRNKRGVKRFKYVLNLNIREVVKYLFKIRYI